MLRRWLLPIDVVVRSVFPDTETSSCFVILYDAGERQKIVAAAAAAAAAGK